MAAPKGNTFALGHGFGKPPIFNSPEELEQKVIEYFQWCINQGLSPQITGLTLFLGFQSRSSLDDYCKRTEDYSYIIKKAKLFVESGYEEMLQDGKMSAIFALKNMGWKDRNEHGFTDKDGNDVPLSVILQPQPNCEPLKDDEK